MFTEHKSVGLDVHARSLVAAAIDGVTGELIHARLTPSHEHNRSWLGDLLGPGRQPRCMATSSAVLLTSSTDDL